MIGYMIGQRQCICLNLVNVRMNMMIDGPSATMASDFNLQTKLSKGPDYRTQSKLSNEL